MNTEGIYEDIAFIKAHIYHNPKEATRRWTVVESDDQLVLMAVLGFLCRSGSLVFTEQIQILDKPLHKAIVDVVRKSNLCNLIEYDIQEGVIKYRNTVPDSTREEIASFCHKNSEVYGVIPRDRSTFSAPDPTA